MINNTWQQGELVEIAITDLTDTGTGVGRFEGRVVFVPDTAPGDRVLARLVRVKPQFADAKLHELLESSEQRTRPGCIVADKCGGCQWQHIDYFYQLAAKRNQVVQALQRIGGIETPPVSEVLASKALGYRNKVSYPFGVSPTGHLQAGYYQKNSHRLVNLNRCPVQDNRLDPLLAEIKQDIQQLGWTIYDENLSKGQLRHLSLRIGRRTGEVLLTLITKSAALPGLDAQAQVWMKRYPQLVGVCLNINPHKTNVIFGEETRVCAGRGYCVEEFAGLQFHLGPDTFFQINTETAEALLNVIVNELHLQGTELLVDAYCGIGTFTLPLARRVRSCIGLEVQPAAILHAKENAKFNGLTNTTFYAGPVEKLLPEMDVSPDIILLDPPRKGCDPAVLETLVKIQPPRIVYISCKPATLARDLKYLCSEGGYSLTRVQPADFFPQTSHVECAAFLTIGD
ncbi:23S rRNA (uracil(1939)-C(5))-methyltransferase RlmD [Ancylothrix sp. C2]|uniref:23S rRNA (uracil(1939)-C(5))-methyltransferase RlmD n=1 Tax=Ancylothrix sp. D3o TaxID=2953691 RepID=UPI0021BB13A6|nr:23S rRNA (uracil(1939)-C(5))-methyltransferase RlmD [Ancylothrix sp. D3o]MCT7951972.1 23S rRNA (uracil(1939)-C(5))-methyltransferase RlmD [Ancylothrix sp. D3o]